MLKSAKDVTDKDLGIALEVWQSWFSQEDRIDWEDFIDRMAKYGERYDFEEYDSPAIRKIQRYIRDVIRQG